MDLAKRAFDQSFHIDPIVRSLLDTDFYKLLMGQFIYERFPDVHVTFGLTNRTRSVRLADLIPEEELRAQLDHVRGLSFRPNELIWLSGATFYGQERIFQPDFIDFLRDLRLPDYDLRKEDGQYVLTFTGSWAQTTWWEIHALSIISELKSRAAHRQRGAMELDFLYAGAKAKLLAKLKRLNGLEGLALSDFGTRRRHAFLWHEWVVLAMAQVLGERFVGTSNAFLAMKHGFDAKGTNAHELPMVLAALATDDAALKASQYDLCQQWQDAYSGNLLVALPDTFGTTQFLKDAPTWMPLNWRGYRPDLGAGGGGRGNYRLAAGPRRRPRQPVRAVLRWLGRSHRRLRAAWSRYRRHSPAFRGAHRSRLWLGHQRQQRLPRLRSAGRDSVRSDLVGLQGDRRRGPSGRQAVGQLPQGLGSA